MTTIYGIKNCDTVKKATKWLDKQAIEYTFFDFKKQPLTAELLTEPNPNQCSVQDTTL